MLHAAPGSNRSQQKHVGTSSPARGSHLTSNKHGCSQARTDGAAVQAVEGPWGCYRLRGGQARPMLHRVQHICPAAARPLRVRHAMLQCLVALEALGMHPVQHICHTAARPLHARSASVPPLPAKPGAGVTNMGNRKPAYLPYR